MRLSPKILLPSPNFGDAALVAAVQIAVGIVRALVRVPRLWISAFIAGKRGDPITDQEQAEDYRSQPTCHIVSPYESKCPPDTAPGGLLYPR